MTCLYKEVAKERGYNKLNRMHYQLLELNLVVSSLHKMFLHNYNLKLDRYDPLHKHYDQYDHYKQNISEVVLQDLLHQVLKNLAHLCRKEPLVSSAIVLQYHKHS